MRFASPEVLSLLWVVLALLVLRVVARIRRGRRSRSFAAHQAWSRLTPDLSGGRRGLRDGLRFAAAASLILALARPQFGQRLAVLTREGIDVVVAIDTSASMLVEDLRPNRLEVAKRAAAGLIDRLRGDRIGIVVFAGSAFVQCPLTLDSKAARLLLDSVAPEIVPDPGTALGAAIERSATAFPGEERRFKALVLFTDGEDTAADPLPAARRAAEKGVRILTVGIGTPRGEPIPVRNPRGSVVGYKKDRSGEVVVSRLDEGTLTRVAEVAGGRFFRASPSLSEVEALYAEIDAMEKREIQGGFHSHYQDRFHWFAVAAFVLLAAARLLGEKRRSRTSGVSLRAITGIALLLAAAALTPPLARADGGAQAVRAGNRAYARGKPDVAAEHYLRALSEDPDRAEIQYNLGNALYAQERFTDAQAAFGAAAGRADSALSGPLSYNSGNAHFREGRYAEAVEAYKQTLRRDPSDEDARWNLELALRKLKEENKRQEQEKQNEEQKDEKQQDGSQKNQDQKQDGDKGQEQEQREPQQSGEQQGAGQEQNQEQDPKQDQGQGQDGGRENPSTGAPMDPTEGEGQGSAQESRPGEQEMTAAEAARLLEALGNDEQKLLRERFRGRGRRIDVEKDW